MLHLLPGIDHNKPETKERALTFPVIILLLLMIAFIGAGVYISISTFLH